MIVHQIEVGRSTLAPCLAACRCVPAAAAATRRHLPCSWKGRQAVATRVLHAHRCPAGPEGGGRGRGGAGHQLPAAGGHRAARMRQAVGCCATGWVPPRWPARPEAPRRAPCRSPPDRSALAPRARPAQGPSCTVLMAPPAARPALAPADPPTPPPPTPPPHTHRPAPPHPRR